MKLRIFVSVLLLFSVKGFCFTPTYYLNPHKKLAQYDFKNWTTNNGLPSNSLLHIYQTRDGYLWISGYSGLIRFDGNSFTVFNTSNTDAFKSNVIRNLAEDSKGNLWMTTQGSGLVSYNNGKFTAYGGDIDMEHLCRALLVDKNDRIWSAAPGFGWFYFEKGKFHFLDYKTSLKNIEIRSIVQSDDGTIWFAALGEGIFKYENGKLSSFKLPGKFENEWVYSLYPEKNKLWIGTSNGIYLFDGNEFSNPFPEIKSTVNNILSDQFDDLWIGTTDGLYRKNAITERLEYITTEHGLINNFIVDFLFDFEGNFWITQYKGGLTRIRDSKFTNYTYDGGLPDKVVNAICEIADSTYLAGFDNGSLIMIENGNIKPFRLKTNLSTDRIRHIMIDSKKKYWISTYNGLLEVSPDGNEHFYDDHSKLTKSKIRLTFEDSKGNIWVGTRNSGVFKISATHKAEVFDVTKGLNSNLIMSIKEDNSGNIWVGTSEGKYGLNMISPSGKIKNFTSADGFNSDIVFNIFTDNDNLIWIASNNGLWLLKDNVFHCFTSKNGLSDESPYDIIEDDYGFMWLPFSDGIMKIFKTDLIDFADGKIAKINCSLLNKHDGMKQSECNPTARVLKDSHGHLLFPTLDGIAMVDPLNVMYNNYIPPVYIEKIKTDNTFADIPGTTIFKPGIKRFTFYYTAPCLYEADKVKFKYRLKGFESEWNEAENVRSVSYTNLSKGKYTFQVVACNNDQVWNEKGAEYTLNIKPWFYETPWFYLLLILLFISIFISIYRIRVSQLEKQKKELEKIVEMRTSEILDKNKELEKQKNEIQIKSNILLTQKNEIEKQAEQLRQQKEELNEMNISKDKIISIISHDLRTPLGNIKNITDLLIKHPERFDEEKRKKIFANFTEITSSTYYLIDNLLKWAHSQRGILAYNPELIQIYPIIADVLHLLQPTYEKKQVNVNNLIDESTLVYADVNMVNTILRNLIENAIKFTPSQGHIEIFSLIKSNMIEVGIKDNGIGIDEENVKKITENKEITSTYGTNSEKGSGLGLILCREFIEKNGGEFSVKSELGKGSTFYFTLNRFQV